VTMPSSVERVRTEIRLLPQWRHSRGVLSIWKGSVTVPPPRPIKNRAHYTLTHGHFNAFRAKKLVAFRSSSGNPATQSGNTIRQH
jgi:hypothetical protein